MGLGEAAKEIELNIKKINKLKVTKIELNKEIVRRNHSTKAC